MKVPQLVRGHRAGWWHSQGSKSVAKPEPALITWSCSSGFADRQHCNGKTLPGRKNLENLPFHSYLLYHQFQYIYPYLHICTYI